MGAQPGSTASTDGDGGGGKEELPGGAEGRLGHPQAERVVLTPSPDFSFTETTSTGDLSQDPGTLSLALDPTANPEQLTPPGLESGSKFSSPGKAMR